LAANKAGIANVVVTPAGVIFLSALLKTSQTKVLPSPSFAIESRFALKPTFAPYAVAIIVHPTGKCGNAGIGAVFSYLGKRLVRNIEIA
jgi:hypothetical protein